MRPQVTAGFEVIGADPHAHRFCVWTEPSNVCPEALVVYVHPFAEEMNKSRRMAALQARAFAGAGAMVLQMDLLGCGDSAGSSGDATWAAWVDDVVAAFGASVARFARRWPGRETPALWLWGLRAGCLLAVDAATRMTHPVSFIFWQPALVGKSLLQQFLRLQSIGAAIGTPGRGVALEPARATLDAGSSAMVAGYILHPALAGGLERSRLAPPLRPARVLWFDVSTRPDSEPAPAVLQAQDAWRAAQHALLPVTVHGPQFWQTTEIEEAPALIDATLAAWQAPAVRSAHVASPTEVAG